VNERRQYEVLLPFMHHVIFDGFGRSTVVHGSISDLQFKVDNSEPKGSASPG